MKDSRSASQILFGLLPQQTIDAKGGVWKVTRWVTEAAHGVDLDELRRALERAVAPWANASPPMDGGFYQAMRTGRPIRVETLDRHDGVRVAPFPKRWRCKNRRCNRLHRSPRARCPCGSNGPHGQLPFVLFHDACGEIREPFYPECPEHNQVRMDLPGTTNLYEIKLSCPVCRRDLGQPFLNTNCQCGLSGHRKGRMMEFGVHRSAAVYTPRSIVIVNPPSKQQMRELIQAGGAQAALTWLADGMKADWIDKVEGAKAASLRRELLDRGLDPETVDQMMASSNLSESATARPKASTIVLEEAQNEAAAIALAMSKTRLTIEKLTANARENVREKYESAYPRALKNAGIERIDLVESFPVLTGQYGYTRGDQEPGRSRLRAFVEKDGTFVVYGDLAETEALVTRLNPTNVGRWLNRRGHPVRATGDARSDYEAILQSFGADPTASPIFDDVLTLVHSFSHRMVRHASFYAGIDRNALSELLFPYGLAFVTYAVPRGDFVLGGLQALYEHDLHTLLDRIVNDEQRCPLDPGCSSNPSGAACAVCLHLGEPSCRLFNTKLDRNALFDRNTGYFPSL